MPLHSSWPRALVHIDGDAFFASVEQAVKPYLKGKPVVTGKERNIVAAASYEAKRFGVKRGVTLWDAKKMCPGLVILPTDYETVSIFSKRMFDIMRRYTPAVEEYSVDEAFIDISGLRRLHHASYQIIAKHIQQDIHRELDITVSVGLSITKVLTKIASGLNKPAGFVSLSSVDRENFLQNYPLEKVWTIGPNTAALLRNFGLHTALQFARHPLEDVERILTKPGIETWHELNGESVWPVTVGERSSQQSISKTKTFTPPSDNKDFVYAQLVKNLESACIKARRFRQAPKKIVIFLKHQDHRTVGLEVTLIRPSAFPVELLPDIHRLFNNLFVPHTLYRASGVVLSELVSLETTQMSLFEQWDNIQKIRRLYAAIDAAKNKYGKYAVHHAASLPAHGTQHLTARGDLPLRKQQLLKGETFRRHLPLPILN